MPTVEGGAQLVRSASTLRIFQNTTRKLVHFGPSSPDSISLLLHSTLTFLAFLIFLSLFVLVREGHPAWTTYGLP